MRSNSGRGRDRDENEEVTLVRPGSWGCLGWEKTVAVAGGMWLHMEGMAQEMNISQTVEGRFLTVGITNTERQGTERILVWKNCRY